MKRNQKKRKPIGKKGRAPDSEEEIYSSEGQVGQAPPMPMEQSAETLKRRLTARVIREYQPMVGEDDFFIPAPQEAAQQTFALQTRVEYRGHTRCITGIQLTESKMYSCSKDRSIIRWDRETGKKEFVSRGEGGHTSDILCLTLHTNENVLATAGEDMVIRLWDVRASGLVESMRSHKNHINCVRFGVQSHNLCSGSSDLTLKLWDWGQRGLIQTFYEHNAEVLDLDAVNGSDFLSCGNDHQAIVWKTEKETKIVYKGHEYAIDRARFVNQERFVTASQDGQLCLFWGKKSKAVGKVQAHASGWIGGMDCMGDMVATGAIDGVVRIWDIKDSFRGVGLREEIPVKGIVTDIKLRRDYLAYTECDEHRLGRWVTTKCRNKISVHGIKR